MSTPDFLPSLILLLRECFDGIRPGEDSTWFVEGKEGIKDALLTVSPEAASTKPNAGCPSIAAHAYHMLYALKNLNGYIGRPKVEGDWESSWLKQSVTAEEWQFLARDIQEESDYFIGVLESNPPDLASEADAKTAALGQLAHMAYHLGAIRALMKVV